MTLRPLHCAIFALSALLLPLPAGGDQVKPLQLTAPDQVPDGLVKSDWQSIRSAFEAGRHAFHPVEGGWQALNPGQQWTAKFDGRGFLTQPKLGNWQWGLELRSYGFPGVERVIQGEPAVEVNGQRLTYDWNASIQEWFVNDQRGLEHGFTLRERPLGGGDAPLVLNLTVRGNLQAQVSSAGTVVAFLDATGAPLLSYSGLKVWDSDGQTLRSHFVSQSSGLQLLVEERGARYPLTIDPIAQQQAYLKSGNNGAGTDILFGYSVAISGDTVVVGAYKEDSSTTGVNSTPNDNTLDAGAAYVFVRSGTTWSQQAYLKASNTGESDRFGCSVAISGDTVVVGARLEDSSTTGVNSSPNESGTDAGAAYVFVRSGTKWSQQAYLKAGNAGAGDWFGISVAISGETAVVGAYYEDSSTAGVDSTPNENSVDSGAAYVFARSGTRWSQQAYLKPGNPGVNDWFGRSVAISGDTLVVGAPGEESSTAGVDSTPNELAADAGAAYVFVFSGTTWSQQAYLKAANTGASDYFGISVAVSGETVVVGAYNEDSSTTGVNATPNELAADAGAAYVFVRSGATWSQQAYLKAGNTGAGDYFGISVAVSADTVVVGAYSEDSGISGVNSPPNELAENAGAVYVFVRNGTTWSQQAFLKAGNLGLNDSFGIAVAISGDTVVVGAIGEDSSTTGVNSFPNEGASDSGAGYMFVRTESGWSQEAFLKASNLGMSSGKGDNFGYSVAVSGDTVVVGAYRDDSSTSGVDSIPDKSSSDSGAAYVFVRSGTTWSQQAYLKAGNPGAGDFFGISVAISGDMVVVGAPYENSSTAGINSTPDDSSIKAGAAYVFVRTGTTWSQQAYLKAGNTNELDQFGIAVAISGETVVVGANGQFSSSGAAYVFVRNGATWSQQAFLKAGNVGSYDNFGWSVAVSVDTIVIGALNEDSSTTGANSIPNENAANSGAAYVFVRSGTTWNQQAYLKAGNTGAGDQFGRSVAVSGSTVAVGAAYEDSSTNGVNLTPNEAAVDSGAAYVFVRSGTTWSQQAYLKAGNTGASDVFGLSVAVSGDVVVVGARAEDSNSTGVNSTPNESGTDAGAAYVFLRSGTTWSQKAYLKAGNSSATDYFGHAVAVSEDTVVVGAYQEDSGTRGGSSTPNETALDAGAVNIFSGFVGPEINLIGNSVSIADGDSTPALADYTNFDGVTIGIGGGSRERIFTLQNTGLSSLNLTGMPKVAVSGTHSADFTVTVQPVSPVLAGGSTSFQVSFLPLGRGLRHATLSIGSDDDDEATFDFALQGAGVSVYQGWSTTNNVSSTNATLSGANGLANLLNFAFGIHPLTGGNGPLQYSGTLSGGGAIDAKGLPTTLFERNGTGTDIRAVFVRRKDYLLAGLTYTPQFSVRLDFWLNSATEPIVLADDGTHELVSVPYPIYSGRGQAQFFRIKVDLTL